MNSDYGSMEETPTQKHRRSAAGPVGSRWRNPNRRLSYTTELLRAVRQVRRTSPPCPSPSFAVRSAADRILAVAAGGRSLWSAAILSGRFVRQNGRRSFKSSDKSTDMERKLRVLGRLVPGCSELPLSSLLKETSDYIAALEMQVQTMSELATSLSSLNQLFSL